MNTLNAEAPLQPLQTGSSTDSVDRLTHTHTHTHTVLSYVHVNLPLQTQKHLHRKPVHDKVIA